MLIDIKLFERDDKHNDLFDMFTPKAALKSEAFGNKYICINNFSPLPYFIQSFEFYKINELNDFKNGVIGGCNPSFVLSENFGNKENRSFFCGLEGAIISPETFRSVNDTFIVLWDSYKRKFK